MESLASRRRRRAHQPGKRVSTVPRSLRHASLVVAGGIAVGLAACGQAAPECDLSAVRLVYLEPGDTPPGATLPESWLERRCLGIVTVADPQAVPPLLEVSPGAGVMVNRRAADVLGQPWVAVAYENRRPIIGFDMSVSEMAQAAPFLPALSLKSDRRPGERIWTGFCRRGEDGQRATTQRFASTAHLLSWSADCR